MANKSVDTIKILCSAGLQTLRSGLAQLFENGNHLKVLRVFMGQKATASVEDL